MEAKREREGKKVGSGEKRRERGERVDGGGGVGIGRSATTGLNATMREPEGLSMVADSRARPGVWAAGIQVEAAANPKESSPWLPAPASTGLHADLLAGIHAYTHTHTHTYIHTRASIHTQAHLAHHHACEAVRVLRDARIIPLSRTRSCPFR